MGEVGSEGGKGTRGEEDRPRRGGGGGGWVKEKGGGARPRRWEVRKKTFIESSHKKGSHILILHRVQRK